MSRELTLFIGTFTTLLAIINPFEVLPVYLKFLQGKDVAAHRQVAWKACTYALFLSLFFLIFGTLMLRLFGVPLAMVRRFFAPRHPVRRPGVLLVAEPAAEP